MKTFPILLAFVLSLVTLQNARNCSAAEPLEGESDKSRLIVLADMGNETDEVQQMLHLLMCSNAIDIEGLIAVTGIFLQPNNPTPYRSVTHPEVFQKLIDGYERVYPNLHHHAEGWPPPFQLRIKVAAGQPEYGVDGIGEGKSTEGSNWIINRVTQDDPRPIHVVVNAGSNTLAQALLDYRNSHTPEELDAFVAKLRVYENAAQDNAGAWINHEFQKTTGYVRDTRPKALAVQAIPTSDHTIGNPTHTPRRAKTTGHRNTFVPDTEHSEICIRFVSTPTTDSTTRRSLKAVARSHG